MEVQQTETGDWETGVQGVPEECQQEPAFKSMSQERSAPWRENWL